MRRIRIRKKKDGKENEKGNRTKEARQKERKDVIKNFTVKAKLKTTLSHVMKEISQLGFSNIDVKKNEIIAMNVEREDIKGKPYLYTKYIFRKDGIDVEYSIPKEVNMNKRKVDVSALTLKVLLILSEYDIDWKGIMRRVLESLSVVSELFTDNYAILSNKYELLKEQYTNTKKERDELYNLLDKNNKLVADYERQIDKLNLRIRKLEGLTNETLKEELLIWLKNHRGKINVSEFANIYNITPARVEEGLDMLLKEGYISKE